MQSELLSTDWQHALFDCLTSTSASNLASGVHVFAMVFIPVSKAFPSAHQEQEGTWNLWVGGSPFTCAPEVWVRNSRQLKSMKILCLKIVFLLCSCCWHPLPYPKPYVEVYTCHTSDQTTDHTISSAYLSKITMECYSSLVSSGKNAPSCTWIESNDSLTRRGG
jgi:hypothetical protein